MEMGVYKIDRTSTVIQVRNENDSDEGNCGGVCEVSDSKLFGVERIYIYIFK